MRASPALRRTAPPRENPRVIVKVEQPVPPGDDQPPAYDDVVDGPSDQDPDVPSSDDDDDEDAVPLYPRAQAHFQFGGQFNYWRTREYWRQIRDFDDKLWECTAVNINLSAEGLVLSIIVHWKAVLWPANVAVPRRFGAVLTVSKRFPLYTGCVCARKVQVKGVRFASTRQRFSPPRPVCEVLEWVDQFRTSNVNPPMPPGFRQTPAACTAACIR